MKLIRKEKRKKRKIQQREKCIVERAKNPKINIWKAKTVSTITAKLINN